jgi:hypothetical protein
MQRRTLAFVNTDPAFQQLLVIEPLGLKDKRHIGRARQ